VEFTKKRKLKINYKFKIILHLRLVLIQEIDIVIIQERKVRDIIKLFLNTFFICEKVSLILVSKGYTHTMEFQARISGNTARIIFLFLKYSTTEFLITNQKVHLVGNFILYAML
jgi:hypothetical protein